VKLVHMAAKVNENGDVSALCFSRERPINLRMATWTLLAKHVTCPRCKRALAREAKAIG
jgi:hypothetical protein